MNNVLSIKFTCTRRRFKGERTRRMAGLALYAFPGRRSNLVRNEIHGAKIGHAAQRIVAAQSTEANDVALARQEPRELKALGLPGWER
jgi:hypothetical protein